MAEELENFTAIRRADGDLIMGEYAWMSFDGDWVMAEEDDEDGVVYEVVEMRPRLVERRTYRSGKWVEDPEREMCEDCGGDHLGDGTVCDA